jgi:hypothetical protein
MRKKLPVSVVRGFFLRRVALNRKRHKGFAKGATRIVNCAERGEELRRAQKEAFEPHGNQSAVRQLGSGAEVRAECDNA